MQKQSPSSGGSSSPFRDLVKQTPMPLRAEAYGRAALRLSRLAAMLTRCELDISYGKLSYQRLDLYMPDSDQGGRLPVFVNFHGGGHKWGYKEWCGLNAPAIVAFPALYISVEYGLADPGSDPYLKIPDQLEDAGNALAWVYRNIARYGGDPANIHVGGHSAGARLSALLALRKDIWSKHGLPADVVKGCFPVSGSYDSRDVTVYGEDTSTSERAVSDPGLAKAISPTALVEGNKVPFFVTWAENDNAMAKASGPAFVLALREAGARAKGYMFPLFDHFWIHIDQQRQSNLWTRTLKASMTGVAAT